MGHHVWRPYMKARVEIPRLSVGGALNFLIDTGADRTTIHPVDLQAIGVRHPDLDASQKWDCSGIGGTVAYSMEKVVLHFKKVDLCQEVAIGPLELGFFNNAQEGRLPSLIGRDVLSQGSLMHDFIGNQLHLDLHSGEEIKKENFLRATLNSSRYAQHRTRARGSLP